jgi:oligopeptide transport system ATP-binding protein
VKVEKSFSQGPGPIVLEARRLQKTFPIPDSHSNSFFRSRDIHVKVVDDLSLTIHQGEILGLVGESGSGKSTLGRLLIRLIKPTSGEIFFRGENFLSLSGKALRSRRKNFQMIFQDPAGSLDPRMTVRQILSQPFQLHFSLSSSQLEAKVRELLEQVGLDENTLDRHPHEFSGGQRQRLCIARAIALAPSLIICDEPVSSLDVSIQSQILNLLKDLQRKFSLSYLFISHDLSVIEFICDRVAVMYLGKIVEIADRDQIFSDPKHPYTQALIAAVPRFGDGKKQVKILPGEVPNPMNPPKGCAFHPRCVHQMSICTQKNPKLVTAGKRLVSCWLINPNEEDLTK